MSTPAGRKATWRMGPQERRRLNAVAVVVIVVLLFIALRPIVAKMINRRDWQTCQENVRRISKALASYSSDWDEALPPSSTWMDAARGNMTATSGSGFTLDRFFHCPRDKSKGVSYAYNDLLSGLRTVVGDHDEAGHERLRDVGSLERAPLLIEKHGGAEEAHLNLPDWAAVQRSITMPHDLPPLTASLVMGSGLPASIDAERLTDRMQSAQAAEHRF